MQGYATHGAGDGNRTRVACLEGRKSTTDLHRRRWPGLPCKEAPALPVFPGRQKQKEEDIRRASLYTRVEPLVGFEPTTC